MACEPHLLGIGRWAAGPVGILGNLTKGRRADIIKAVMNLIYVVCANIEEAKRISRYLLERHLAACTNIHPITSAYWWEGKIVEDEEVALLIKTVPVHFDRVRDAVLQLHSYQVPCIISIPVDRVEARFLRWLQSEVR